MKVPPRLALQIGAVATLLLTVLAGLALVTYQAFEGASDHRRERLRPVSSVLIHDPSAAVGMAASAALPAAAAGGPPSAGGSRVRGPRGAVVVGGRRWIVTVAAVGPTLPALAYPLGFAGLLLTLLIVALGVLRAHHERRRKDLITHGLRGRKAAERALGTSEARLRSILETAADAIIVLDLADRIVAWNPAAAGLFGRTEGEALGRPIGELVPEENRGAYAAAVAGLRASGRGMPDAPMLELKARSAGGGEFPIELSLSAWGDGEERFVTVIARDVSARAKARAALEASDERHRGILARVPVGIFETDPGGGYLWVNEHWCGIAGIAAEAARGDGWVGAIHPDDRERAVAECARPLIEGEEFASEYRFLRPDGVVTWAAVTAVALRGTEGAVSGRLGTVVNITYRVRAQEALDEAQERLRHAFERSPVGVALVNVDRESPGRFIQVNKALCDITGYGEEALRRMTLQGLSHPDDPTADLALIEWFRRGASSEEVLEKRYLRADGSTVDIELHAAMVRDAQGRSLYAILLVQDVSDRYALERMKDEFLALASHELRTPLTSVMGYLQLVLEEQVGPLNEEQRRLLGVAERNGARLLALVADIHTLARADAGHLAMVHASFDLSGVARHAVEAMQTVAAERGVVLRLDGLDGEIVLDGDPMRIAEVLDNLLSNAMKFTPRGGEVTLALGRRGDDAVIDVADTGTGIPVSEQDEIFERFFRTEAAGEQAIPGTGLGLAISRTIVEAHGGTITFRTRENVGTTFTIRLPVGAAAPGPVASGSPALAGDI